MPIFEDGDPIEDTEFARQQRQLDAKLARLAKKRNDEIMTLHRLYHGEEKEEENDDLDLAGSC